MAAFSVIICTYMRPKSLLRVLQSVKTQTHYPDEIIIVDGSKNKETEEALFKYEFRNLKYFRVKALNRGLTKQRNYGIEKARATSNIMCFLDDDVILETDYFEQLIKTYKMYPNAMAVGGYITNEVAWENSDKRDSNQKFYYDGWMRNEPFRFKIRQKFGLAPDTNPGYLPTFSHGRSVSFLPPSGKIYEVEQIMGGVSSYKKHVFNTLKFSTYFEGYGLYEDADFSLRIAKIGKLYINTNARLSHHHDGSGRPNQYHYGKMVVRNGWYIWRVKYSNPNVKARIKFYATSFLLTLIRGSNVLTSKEKKKAFTETLGRITGWFSLIFNKPKLQ